jgi:hypothetical protein
LRGPIRIIFGILGTLLRIQRTTKKGRLIKEALEVFVGKLEEDLQRPQRSMGRSPSRKFTEEFGTRVFILLLREL